MVTASVPEGVPGMVVVFVPDPEPPQAERTLMPANSKTISRLARSSVLRRRFTCQCERPKHRNVARASPCHPAGVLIDAVVDAVVEMVRLIVAGVLPESESVAGANVHDALPGSELHEKLIVPLNPPVGMMVRVVVAVWPAIMVADEGEAVTVKSGTTTAIFIAAEVLG